MEVIVQNNLSNRDADHVVVPTNPVETVDSLITAYCTEKGIPHKRFYVLRSKHGEIFDSTRSLGTCGIHNGDTVYLCSENENGIFSGRAQWWILCVVCLLIGCVGIITLSVIKAVDDEDLEKSKILQYAVVLDAGSTHTALYLYKWKPQKINGTADLLQDFSCRAKGGGLSSYTSNPDKAGPSLEDCLQSCTSIIPGDSIQRTPIYLAATAGMRLVHEANLSISDAILTSVRNTIKKYSFEFTRPHHQVRILSGQEEGVYGWITVNYLLDVFGTYKASPPTINSVDLDIPTTYGALDMGGASTQLTFIPRPDLQVPVPPTYQQVVLLYGRTYTVYTNSFLCYGRIEIERRLKALLANENPDNETVINPCAPKGFTVIDNTSDIFEAPCTKGSQAVMSWGSEILKHPNISKNFTQFNGSSDTTECKVQVDKLFNFTQCPYGDEHCSFNQHFIPPVRGDFIGFSFFFFGMEYLNLTKDNTKTNFSLEEFHNATDVYCSKSYADIKDIPAFNPNDRTSMCFDTQFIYTLLTKGYKFNTENWKTISFMKKIAGKDVGWSLGYMLNMTNSLPSTSTSTSTVHELSDLSFGLLIVVFVVFIVLAFGFVYQGIRTGRRARNNLYMPIQQGSYGSV